eukprot:TRINITY_DN4193_c0_g1_i1.p1 TRINITY_DN4193_c0_g1~~TRINITY_DN4193_c0_g1_i1.p1  ORF type:complete len:156 (-),score=27.77 TRINITY_DN4193_c0_g1_i1:167-634(-)
MNTWKRYVLEHIVDDRIVFEFDVGTLLALSNNGNTITHNVDDTSASEHLDMFGKHGWATGRHRWHVRLDGLELDSNMWTAVGISKSKRRSFTYSPDSGFVGGSSAGNIFYERESYTLKGPDWKNGSTLTALLNCKEGQFILYCNGQHQKNLADIL